MRIIEAMKQIKDLIRKSEDLRSKIKTYHVDFEHESPTYPDQRGTVSGWLQSHRDLVKEISRLRFAIQRTNITTKVPIKLGENLVVKTIAEWIHRRRDLATLEKSAWDALNDKGLPNVAQSKKTSGEVYEVKLRRHYDPQQRDHEREVLASEPLAIDAALEIVNAVTDLVEETK